MNKNQMKKLVKSQLKKQNINLDRIDVEAIIDSSLTFEENWNIIKKKFNIRTKTDKEEKYRKMREKESEHMQKDHQDEEKQNGEERIEPTTSSYIPSNFVFFDTEAERVEDEEDYEIQKLAFGTGIYWDRTERLKQQFVFQTVDEFWKKIENILKRTRNVTPNQYNSKHVKDLWVVSHNLDYDIKIIEGIDYLCNNFEIEFFSFKKGAFIIRAVREFEDDDKDDKHITMISSTNYFQSSLDSIGKSLNMEKKHIDIEKFLNEGSPFNEKTVKYCMRDTEIVFEAVKRLIHFLQDNRLSGLKLTASSIAFDTFRKEFYLEREKSSKQQKCRAKNHEIVKHNKDRHNETEIKAYKGGLCEIFQKNHNYQRLEALDINSMYPYIMKTRKMPIRLEQVLTDRDHNYIYLKKQLEKFVKNEDYKIIAEVKISIPSEKSFILKRTKNLDNIEKSMRLGGEFWERLCGCEIEHVLNKGNIVDISKIQVYKGENLFDTYVDFFYDERMKYQEDENRYAEQLCKLFLNSLYGKFGQRRFESKKIEDERIIEDVENMLQFKYCYQENRQDLPFFAKIDTVESVIDRQIVKIGDEYYSKKKRSTPSDNSFIPIAATITAEGRMYLKDLIQVAKLENTWYSDTDSLYVNREGKQRLEEAGLVDGEGEKNLGKLKAEGVFEKVEFISPKFYRYRKVDGEEGMKSKGVTGSAEKKLETDDSIVFQQQQFDSVKSQIRENQEGQKIRNIEKQVSKNYKDAKMLDDGKMISYKYNELKSLR